MRHTGARPPPCAHFRPDLYPSDSHKAAATRADTYGDTSFSPRCSACLASPLQAQASQLRWESPASLCLCESKLLHRAGETTSDLHKIYFKRRQNEIGLGHHRGLPFIFSVLFSVFIFSIEAPLRRTRRALMDEKWVIIPGLTQNNRGQSTMEQAQFQGELSKGRNLFQPSLTSELRLKDEC